jgi:hypothetical protein
MSRTLKVRTLGRSTHKWDDNIKIDIQEFGWRVTNFIAVAQDRDRWRWLVNAVINFRVNEMLGIS